LRSCFNRFGRRVDDHGIVRAVARAHQYLAESADGGRDAWRTAIGIHPTGIAALVDAAHVSTRPFYQHFPTKNALVEAYLHGFEADTPIASEQHLGRDDLTPSERLLAIFDPLESDDATVLRGCPFHNAVVDAAGEMPHVAQLVKQHKQAFLDRLINTALEAGAPDPVSLGRQLAVVYEGAAACPPHPIPRR
jgi:AcrR family transcriptional regulator